MRKIWTFHGPEDSHTSLKFYAGAFWQGFYGLCEDGRISFYESISSESYVNAFPYVKFRKYAGLEDFSLRLCLMSEEDSLLKLSVVGINKHRIRLTLHTSLHRLFSKAQKTIEVSLQNLSEDILYVYFLCEAINQEDTKTKIYLDLRESGIYADLQSKEVKTCIVIPTYRREKYVRKNLEVIVKSGLNRRARVVVVDNGQTLDKSLEEIGENIFLVPNRNVGGAGGFVKGLLYALDHFPDTTHILFMDDDIQLEPFAVERALDFIAFAKEKIGIGGSMLKLSQPHIIHESSAVYVVNNHIYLKLNKHGLSVLNPEDLPQIVQEIDYNYYGWWFYLVPVDVFRECGLPLPLFFRADDMEYNIRLKVQMTDLKIIDLNGCFSIHEDFESKADTLTDYLISRNELIMRSIHFQVSTLMELKHLWRRLLLSLLSYRYERAMAILEGYEDFLKGPDIIKDPFPEKRIKEIKERYATERATEKPFFRHKILGFEYEENLNIACKKTKLRIIAMILKEMLIGLLGRKANKERLNAVLVADLHSHNLCLISKYSAVLYYNRDFDRGYMVVRDSRKFLKVFLKALKLSLKFALSYGKVKKKYLDSFKELTSEQFWRKYLNA